MHRSIWPVYFFLTKKLIPKKINYTGIEIKEKYMKPRGVLLVDQMNCAIQAREYSLVQQDQWGEDKVVRETFDICDLIGFAQSHWNISCRFYRMRQVRGKKFILSHTKIRRTNSFGVQVSQFFVTS